MNSETQQTKTIRVPLAVYDEAVRLAALMQMRQKRTVTLGAVVAAAVEQMGKRVKQ